MAMDASAVRAMGEVVSVASAPSVAPASSRCTSERVQSLLCRVLVVQPLPIVGETVLLLFPARAKARLRNCAWIIQFVRSSASSVPESLGDELLLPSNTSDLGRLIMSVPCRGKVSTKVSLWKSISELPERIILDECGLDSGSTLVIARRRESAPPCFCLCCFCNATESDLTLICVNVRESLELPSPSSSSPSSDLLFPLNELLALE